MTPIPDGTRVSIEHRNLPPDDATQHAVGGTHVLTRLSVTARGGDPGPDAFATAGNG